MDRARRLVALRGACMRIWARHTLYPALGDAYNRGGRTAMRGVGRGLADAAKGGCFRHDVCSPRPPVVLSRGTRGFERRRDGTESDITLMMRTRGSQPRRGWQGEGGRREVPIADARYGVQLHEGGSSEGGNRTRHQEMAKPFRFFHAF